jgi:hypothetical protein
MRRSERIADGLFGVDLCARSVSQIGTSGRGQED